MEYPQPPGSAFHAPPPPTVPLRPSAPPTAVHVAAAPTPSAAGSKRKRQGNHLVHGVVAAAAPPSSNAAVLPPVAVAGSRKSASSAPSGARAKSQSKGPRKKAAAARGRVPPPPPPAGHVLPDLIHSTGHAYNVFDEMSESHNIHSTYTKMLEENAVDLSAPLDEFDSANQAEVEAEVEQGDDGGDEVEELEEAEFNGSQEKIGKTTGNYTEVEDVCLIRAWESVSLDAVTGKDQSAMKYWQRIEDKYHRVLPFRSGRSLKSIQGRWDMIKKTCGRWSGCLEQVQNAPPSGVTIDDYVSVSSFC